MNKCISVPTFLANLKSAKVVPLFMKDKKKNRSEKPKEQLQTSIYTCKHLQFHVREISKTFDQLISKYLFSFLKQFQCVAQCLVSLIKLWKERLDNKNAFGGILTDLSKGFDFFNLDYSKTSYLRPRFEN